MNENSAGLFFFIEVDIIVPWSHTRSLASTTLFVSWLPKYSTYTTYSRKHLEATIPTPMVVLGLPHRKVFKSRPMFLDKSQERPTLLLRSTETNSSKLQCSFQLAQAACQRTYTQYSLAGLACITDLSE